MVIIRPYTILNKHYKNCPRIISEALISKFFYPIFLFEMIEKVKFPMINQNIVEY